MGSSFFEKFHSSVSLSDREAGEDLTARRITRRRSPWARDLHILGRCGFRALGMGGLYAHQVFVCAKGAQPGATIQHSSAVLGSGVESVWVFQLPFSGAAVGA